MSMQTVSKGVLVGDIFRSPSPLKDKFSFIYWTGVLESSSDFQSLMCHLFSTQMSNYRWKISLKI